MKFNEVSQIQKVPTHDSLSESRENLPRANRSPTHLKYARLRRLNKKGFVLGPIIGLLVSTAAIVTILLVYVLLSFAFNLFNDVNQWDGTRVDFGREIGFGDVVSYMQDFEDFAKVRFLVDNGKTVEQSMVEVSYDK